MSRPATQRFGFAGVLSFFVGLDAAYRQRRHLSEMDRAQREDLGLTRAEITKELARPVWNAPQHWVR
jgi:uncharacterized protein YjiS (DUF1127 family)